MRFGHYFTREEFEKKRFEPFNESNKQRGWERECGSIIEKVFPVSNVRCRC